ncbi:S8 family peptidase [Desulfotomaculum copahuensis]|uniref:Peptidase S8/S53 domain-containing protein n=1 Tax=Desulfotomaculum copahuensis TaxID=1838280 RepID=A0A1B7LE17_9FIRM|nr:S8 family peptidase [Desulfotomaculum copahuensis]OAT81339.1 hypothetical protein A6M21_10680 [Desulfotomaculum copahuensis]
MGMSGSTAQVEKIILFKRPVMKGKNLRPEYGELLLKHGATGIEPLPLIDGVLCSLPNTPQIQELHAQDDIKALADNARIKLQPVSIISENIQFKSDHYQVIPWGIHRIGADLVWPKSGGERVKVAVLDTGADLEHRDLKGNIKGGVNILHPGEAPADDHGHGTHVCGIIAAVDNDFGIKGTAPKASLYPVKILNRQGEGSFAGIIRGLDWCLRHGIQLVNISFGTDEPNRALHEAVRRAAAGGIIIVAAAGNDGSYQSVDYPAAYPEVVAVAAMDEHDQLAYYSSLGPEIKLAAPGNRIMSTGTGGTFKRMSGTSMAAPHVTGALALLIALAPREKPADLLEMLISSAEKLTALDYGPNNAGLVRADQAASKLGEMTRTVDGSRLGGEDRPPSLVLRRSFPYRRTIFRRNIKTSQR